MAKQISALPTAPSTQRPATFNTEADAFVSALPTFVSEANALATEAATNASKSEDANTTAQSAKDAAQASAQAAGEAKEAAQISASEAEGSAQAASEAKTAAATSAKEAKESAQAAAETKEGLSGSLGALEEMKKIVATGFIDDSKVRTNLTYSSKKIEADFAQKNESSGEQKIYGKALSATGEASSIVVRDSGGYVSSSTPKSEEFTIDHLVCVRGSDGKEKFVPLETIYKNVLERILKENLPLGSYVDTDIFEKIALLETAWTPSQAKRLKNKYIFVYFDYAYREYAVFTPSLEKAELPYPGGSNGGLIFRLIDESNTIYCLANNGKLFRLAETAESFSWEEIALDKKLDATYYIPTQALNKFLYLKGSDNLLYKFDGRNWTKTDMSASGAAPTVIMDNKTSNANGIGGCFINDSYIYVANNGTFKLNLNDLTRTQLDDNKYSRAKIHDYENFALFQTSRGGDVIFAVKDIRKNRATRTVPYTEIHNEYTSGVYGDFVSQKGIFASDGELYFLGEVSIPFSSSQKKKVIAKINKKMLAYYGIEI